MNESQTKAWQGLRDEFVLDLPTTGDTALSLHPDAVLDQAAIFGRTAPLAIEIGSGTGESLVAMAAQRPDLDVVAFEVFAPAVASTLSRIAREGVRNVRIAMVDGLEGLTQLVALASLAELWTYFPDPWHKARHHKRRLVSTGFAALVADRLIEDGRWLLATDWPDYDEWIIDQVAAEPRLAPQTIEPIGPDSRPFGRPLTKYERRGLAAGREIHEHAWRKVTP